MGGDAFPDTLRLSEVEYQRICRQIKTVFDCNINLDKNRIGFPVEVKDKETLCQEMGKGNPYGDVDVVVGMESDVEKLKLIDLLKKSLGATEETYTKKFKECSLLTKERYQVDILFCSFKNFEFLLAFKGNNDFGALLGHLLTPFYLKWSDQGLMLKLKLEGVSNVGTVRTDFLLTNKVSKVCDFLSIPTSCLDGKTRMTTKEIFNVLTSCRIFFNNNNYDQKYKIKERRKRRPVADTFFNLLEAEDEKKENSTLEARNDKRFQDDEIHKMLVNFRNQTIEYSEFIERVSDLFGRKNELIEKWKYIQEKSQASSESEKKFNFYILKEWYPNVDQVKIGKIFAKLKSSKSGNGILNYQNWVEQTDISKIRALTNELVNQL